MGKSKGAIDKGNGKKNVSTNPFNKFSVGKSKHSVLGRRVRGLKKAVPSGNSEAISLRQQSLLKEFSAHVGNHTSTIVDHRISKKLTDADRFQKQRSRMIQMKKPKKSSVYNLNEDDTESLTHYGESLAMDAGDSEPELEEDMDMNNESPFAKGGSGDGNRSHKEVMHEIIEKSRMYRAEAQAQRVEQEELRQKLDDMFGAEFRSLLKEDQGEENLVNGNGAEDEYDKYAKELLFESRVAAEERSKTEEEKAKEAMEELQKAEKERLSRMRLPSKKERMQIEESENDMDGNIEIDPEFQLHSSEEEEEEDDEQIDSDRESSLSAVDDDHTTGVLETNASDSESDPEVSKDVNKEQIPFVFDMPETLSDLLDLFRDRDGGIVHLILSRLRTCFHRSLSPHNNQQLQHLMSLLLDAVFEYAEDSKHSYYLDGFLSVWFEMAKEQPNVAVSLARQHILRFNNQCLESHTFPGIYMIIFSSFMSKVFPMTDLEHPVCTALLHSMANMIVKIPVQSAKDVLSGVIICSEMLRYLGDSNRVIPEIFHFLSGVLYLLSGIPIQSLSKSPYVLKVTFLNQDSFAQNWSSTLSQKSTLNAAKCNLYWLALEESDSFFESEEFLISLYDTTICCIHKLIEKTKSNPCFKELFSPVLAVLSDARTSLQSNKTVEDRLNKMIKDINAVSSRCERSRLPLIIQRKPDEIKSLEPRVVDNFNPERSTDPNKKRVEMNKLQRQVKREEKGARRELRKDTLFIQQEKKRLQEIRDAELEKKHKQVLTFLEGQARDSNLLRKLTKKAKLKK